MKPSVLLVRPPFRENLEYKPQPMALCCLGAHLRRHRPGVRIEVLDAVARDLDRESTIREIVARRPGIVGITLKTPQAPNAYAIARAVKAELGIPVILGGNHVTVMPEEAVRNGADFAVIGEGEETFAEIVGRLLDGDPLDAVPAGAAALREGRLETGPARPLADLNDLAPPDWSLLDLSLYNENIHIHHRKALQVMASRGCPFSCTFCSTYLTWSNRMRWRDPASVVRELQEGFERYGHDTFHFYDDDILEDRDWLTGFLDALERARLPIEWHGIVRVNNVLRCEPLLDWMRRTGCRGFAFGFEAGNDDIYKRQKKGMTLSMTLRAAVCMRDHGFDLIEPLLMNLYPGETLQSMIRSAGVLRLLRAELGIDYHTSRYYATPYPGTAFFENSASEGLRLSRDWDDHFTHFVNFLPHSMLESPVRGVELDTARYRVLFRLHFLSHGDFNRFLVPEEMWAFLGQADEGIFLGEMAGALSSTGCFGDFCHQVQGFTGLSEASAYELTSKVMIHAACFGLLRDRAASVSA